MYNEDMIETSVVVCTRNRGNRVEKSIETILKNQAASFEVILIDQSTNDLTCAAIEPFLSDGRFRYIHSTTVGTGRSRNIGLRESKGEFVLFTDDDCSVPDNWVEVMTGIFKANDLIGMAFCNVLPGPFDPQSGFIPTYSTKEAFTARSIKDKWRARGIGAGMGVRRECALQIGGFDEMLGPGAKFPANEEGDLAVRMLLNGWYVHETKDVAVIHDGFRTWEQGKILAKRNWIGVGAAYAKPIKSGNWRFVSTVLYEGFVNTLLRAVAPVVRLRKPRGFRSFFYFWYGFFLGFQVPVESQSLLFSRE
ncbi:MAG: glycosyltransferase [Candidatus Promineifilaceae bacterium]